jgi:ascorbate-specific PTS system EIIC-type component UlaA
VRQRLAFYRRDEPAEEFKLPARQLNLYLPDHDDYLSDNGGERRASMSSTFSGGQNYLVYAIIMAITFAAGVFIILQGVRLILAEIVPAFTGFSEKLVPNARPALDCPVVYPYAPNAVLIGFLFSFLGGLVGLFLSDS